jgi:hypothetical protein
MKMTLIALGTGLFIAATSSAQTTRPAPTTRAATRSAQDALSQMLKPSAQAAQPLKPVPGTSGMIDITGGPNAIPPDASTGAVMREGTFIVDRVGRLTRSTEGRQMEFTFDADGRNMTDPPVILLPNQNLMKMEAAVSGNRQDLRFRITGEVTEYNGRNYVLLQKVSAVPDVLQPLK